MDFGEFLEIFGVSFVIGILVIFIIHKIRNRPSKKEDKYIMEYGINPNSTLGKIMKIRGSEVFGPYSTRTAVIDIFKRNSVIPVYDTLDLVVFWIPNVEYVINGNNITILGEGAKNLFWFFNFKRRHLQTRFLFIDNFNSI